jgi:hypothetical protein
MHASAERRPQLWVERTPFDGTEIDAKTQNSHSQNAKGHRAIDATLSDMLCALRLLKTTWTMLRIFYEPFEPVTRKSV